MSSTAAAVDLPTPDVSHLKSADYENVYEPVEDSFLLLDALQSDAAELKAQRSAWCISVLSSNLHVPHATQCRTGSGS